MLWKTWCFHRGPYSLLTFLTIAPCWRGRNYQYFCGIQVKIFWVVTLCSIVVGHQWFGGPSCLHLQGEVTGAGKNSIGMKYMGGWRRQQGSRKQWYPTTKLHGVTTWKTSWIFPRRVLCIASNKMVWTCGKL